MGTTNTLDLNNRVSALEKAVSGGDSAQANKADIATEFSVTTAYTAGCFVYYGGKLYQFNADHAAGAWDPTDVVEANVTDQVVSNKAAIDELAESYPADKVMLSDGVTSVEDRFNSHGVTVKSVTADGIKTLSAILDELYSARSVYNYIDFSGVKAYPATTVKYSAITCSSTVEPVIYSIVLKPSGSVCKVHTMNSTGTSWTTLDISSNVPTQGNTYSVRTMY